MAIETHQKLRALGLAGPAGAGKNTAADFLTKHFGWPQTSFAKALREEVERVTLYRDVIPSDMLSRAADGEKEMRELAGLCIHARNLNLNPWTKPTEPMMRRILQLWGTEFRRNVDPGYWVKKLVLDPSTITLVTDVRFTNELAAMQETWYITRSEVAPAGDAHVSEKLSPNLCDVVLHNNGTLLEFEEAVMSAAKRRILRAA